MPWVKKFWYFLEIKCILEFKLRVSFHYSIFFFFFFQTIILIWGGWWSTVESRVSFWVFFWAGLYCVDLGILGLFYMCFIIFIWVFTPMGVLGFVLIGVFGFCSQLAVFPTFDWNLFPHISLNKMFLPIKKGDNNQVIFTKWYFNWCMWVEWLT